MYKFTSACSFLIYFVIFVYTRVSTCAGV